ncbi:hypothetical protein ES708_34629 [subsurface metagenome]
MRLQKVISSKLVTALFMNRKISLSLTLIRSMRFVKSLSQQVQEHTSNYVNI